MRQVLQRLDNGETLIQEVPTPMATGPSLLVQSHRSLISAGTERMLVQFGKSSLIKKAKSQPDKVRQVIDKARTEGVMATIEAVRSKMGTPIPLGYCNAGVITEIGSRSGGFLVGDRVVTNGPHAEFVRVPNTLAAKIPESVSFETAAFTPLAAIGLQGLRLAGPTIGETVVVMGLGLVGLLTAQLARANGCRVIGIDGNTARLALAERYGVEPVGLSDRTAESIVAKTNGVGADLVLMTLSAHSDEPVHQAAHMCRKRGRIVLVGVTGLAIRREDFYEKELSFQVSCSYGPGRYDPQYEEQALDYPLPFVRWTEQRNFEAVLALMAQGKIDTANLVTHRFAIADAQDAYAVVGGDSSSLGVVIEYPEEPSGNPTSNRTLEFRAADQSPANGSVGVVGAGNFAVRTLLPLLSDTGAKLHTIASGGGTSGALAAEKFGFARATTDLRQIFDDIAIDTVFLLTRHDSHAGLVVRGLQAGKNVFVEKPLALTLEQLESVEEAAANSQGKLMVGFNRRFAPLARELQEDLTQRSAPLAIVATVNAGSLPRNHWTQDPAIGGGRLVGEACHWMDLARFLASSAITDTQVTASRDQQGRPIHDIAHLSMSFADGSTAVVHYLASGAGSFPKERIECFWDQKTAVIDNWRRLRRYGYGGSRFTRAKKADKGHRAEVEAWMSSVRTAAAAPIPLDELMEVSKWAIVCAEQARR